MPDVTVYSSPFCPYCYMAKKVLKSKGIPFSEIDVFGSSKKKQEMMERANGRHTVPQIFIGDTHVGGCDDLVALERSGQLDAMLEPAA